MHYQTWADNATLTDNFGNQYKRLTRPRGVGVQSEPLDPTVPVVDTLVFEKPIETASIVQLHLPGGNVGQSGDFDFNIALHTSGARLNAVTAAAEAVAAEAKAKEAAANRAIAEAAEREKARAAAVEKARLDAEKARLDAEAKKRADDAKAEKERREEEAKRRVEEAKAEKERKEEEAKRKVRDKKQRVAEIEALTAKLPVAKKVMDEVESRMKRVKAVKMPSTYDGPLPDDHFEADGTYVYYFQVQKAKRVKDIQKELDAAKNEYDAIVSRLKELKEDE